MIFYISAAVCGVLLLAFDQLTKYYVSVSFNYGETHKFIKGVIDLVYIKNRGAAWGIFTDKRALLLIVTAVVMTACIVLLVKYASGHKLLFCAVVSVLSGGLGNMADRIFRDGSVIDFLHFEFFPSFPVFNIADCAIVLGAGLLVLYFIIETVKDEKKKRLSDNADNREDI